MRAHLESWGLSIEKGPRGAPLVRGVVFRRRKERCMPLTLRSPCALAEARVHGQSRLHRRSVKIGSFKRPRVPSIDVCPLGLLLAQATSNANPPPEPGFAAWDRLPTLFRLGLRRVEARPAAFARSSRACAHGHTPLADFCNRNDPQARSTDPGHLGSSRSNGLRRSIVLRARARFAIWLAPKGEFEHAMRGRTSPGQRP